MYASEGMKERIAGRVSEMPFIDIPFEGENKRGKWVESLDLIAVAAVNVFEQGLFNRDVCRVLADFGDELLVKRLEDGARAVVKKSQMRVPKLEGYYA